MVRPGRQAQIVESPRWLYGPVLDTKHPAPGYQAGELSPTVDGQLCLCDFGFALDSACKAQHHVWAALVACSDQAACQ